MSRRHHPRTFPAYGECMNRTRCPQQNARTSHSGTYLQSLPSVHIIREVYGWSLRAVYRDQ